MKYLTIMPDYTGSCIKDDFSGDLINPEFFKLPRDFLEEIVNWHEAYRKVIPLSEKERKNIHEEIENLDKQGVRISKKLMKLKNVKVRYFSEGKLTYLPFTNE